MKQKAARGPHARTLVKMGGAVAALGLAGAAFAAQPANWSAEGSTAGAQFGTALNASADLNGDGYADLIVGSPGGPDYKGAVDIFYGKKKGLAAAAGFHYSIDMPWAQVGYSPVAADVNGDGYLDLIVGAGNYSGQKAYSGAVMVFFGSAKGFPSTPSQILEGEASNSNFGFGIRSLGDFNGDGYADVVVSSMGLNGGHGRLYVFQGSASGLVSTPVSTLDGEGTQLYFGRTLAVGDANGDGIADLIVGMTATPTAGIVGSVQVYLGSRTGYANTAAQKVLQTTGDDYDWFGDALAYLGDVDGDGFPDLAVGAPKRYKDETHNGEVTIYFGSATGWSAQGRTQSLTAQNFDYFGANLTGGQDLNGDGRPDLVVGASLYGMSYNTSVPFPGKVAVFYGSKKKGFGKTPAYKLSGAADSRDGLGLTVGVADFNRDGVMDLVLGSSVYSGSLASQGRVQMFRNGGQKAATVGDDAATR